MTNLIPFDELKRFAQRTASLRSTAGEISDLYCDVAHQTAHLESMQRLGWTAEAIEIQREALKEGLLALGVAIERLVKLTEAPR